jgi:hypothetical protein
LRRTDSHFHVVLYKYHGRLIDGGAKSVDKTLRECRDAHYPAWLAKTEQVPDKRPQGIFDELMCGNIHQVYAAAPEELRIRRAYGKEVSVCELAALLPIPKPEMFHSNRRRLIDVVTRKERAHGDVTVITGWKSGSGAEHGIEASDFFDHISPHRNAGPETAHVPRVMHRSQHPFAMENIVWDKACGWVVLAGLDTTKSNRDLRVRDED